MNERGTYGPCNRRRSGGRGGAISVGDMGMLQSMMMTPGAIANELDRINTSFEMFDRDLKGAAIARGASEPIPLPTGTAATAENMVAYAKAIAAQSKQVSNDPVVRLYRDVWTPLFLDWHAFFGREREGSWWHNAAYDAEKFVDKLKQVRDQAKKSGLKLTSPDPSDTHEGGFFDDFSKILKVVAIGGLAIGGVWAASQIVQAVKK